MNRTYRLVWNEGCRAWIPVGENAKARGKRISKVFLSPAARRFGAVSVVGALLALPLVAHAKTAADVAANALPTGYELRAGSADAAPITVGNEMTITQHSQRVVYGWKGFDVGTAATVIYGQKPGDMALNIIGGNDPSYILGTLKAPGTVFFVNPNGMYFGNGAAINVGGMLATTMSMDADEFMKGRYRLSNPGSGTIRNESVITAAGSVALIGNTVENAGMIVATTVTLASGNNVSIDLTGDGLIRARVEDPALKARIENSGTIEASVAVALTAGQARDTLDRIVNNTGVIRATGLAERGGDIVLEGGLVTNSGTLDASSATGAGGRVDVLGRNVALEAGSRIDVSGATSGGTAKILGDMKAGRADIDGHIYAKGGTGDGGFIETSAADVRIAKGFRVKALSAANGRAGKWLIDPVDFYITAGSSARTSSGIGATTLSDALQGADVTIATDNTNSAAGNYGDIFVNSAVSWSANTVLTLSAARNILVNADIKATGNAAGLKLYFGGTDGSTAPAAGTYYSIARGARITLSGSNPILWLGNTQYTVVNSATALQNIKFDMSGHYALGSDIDMSSVTGFLPIGACSGYCAQTSFTGALDGLGHTISNVTINAATVTGAPINDPSISGQPQYIGLFSQIGGKVSNLGLIDFQIDMSSSAVENVGLLAGLLTGTVDNVYAAQGQNMKSIVGGSSSRGVGGLVGFNSGTILNSYADATVIGANNVGGLVGYNGATGLIRYSHASGTVTGTAPGAAIGGLVGRNMGAGAKGIYESYTSSNVAFAGSPTSAVVGGFVGYNDGIIADSYATGAVYSETDGGWVAGFVGENWTSGNITGSWSAGSVGGVNRAGFAGNNAGTITNSYWDTTLASGLAGIISGPNTTGVTGLTTAEFLDPNKLANLGFSGGNNNSSTWWMVPGYTRPFLRSEWSSTVSNGHQLQLMAMNPEASYTLAWDIDLSRDLKPADLAFPGGGYGTAASMWAGWTGWNNGTVTSANFSPIGEAGNEFTGAFDGRNHVISNLVVARPSDNNLGLFGVLQGASISNVGLVGVSISGANQVGGLAGYSGGSSIRSVYVTGDVTGTGKVGGLIGYSSMYSVGTTIEDSYVNANVTGPTAGGLVGYNDAGSIARSYSAGTVAGSAGANNRVGGLIGDNNTGGNVIDNSYSVATVSSTGNFDDVGGLVGLLRLGTITNSYAAGAVSATGTSAKAGGIVGAAIPSGYGTVSKTFWDITATGQPTCTGSAYVFDCTGNADMKDSTTFSGVGWDIADAGGSNSVWRIYENQTYPLLRAFLKPLTITADDVSKTYDANPYVSSLTNPVYSVAGAGSSGLLLGTSDAYGSPNAAGTYNPQLYSNQQGYDISYVNGRLTISSSGLSPIETPSDTAPSATEPSATAAGTSATDKTSTTSEAAKVVQQTTDTAPSTPDSNKDRSKDTPETAPQSTNPIAIADSRVDKPADEIVAPGRGKGRMLVCRKG